MSSRFDAIRAAVKAAKKRQNAYGALDQMIEDAIEAYESANTQTLWLLISLRDALRAYQNGRITSGAQNMNLINSTQREDVRHEAGIEAVLDAAGIPHVD